MSIRLKLIFLCIIGIISILGTLKIIAYTTEKKKLKRLRETLEEYYG